MASRHSLDVATARRTEPMIRWGQAPHGTVEMDDLDRRILKMLRPNARRSYASIARAVGVSEPTVRNRVDRLVKQGAILPWTGVNPAAIGLPVDVMVGIRVNRGYGTGVGERLAAMEGVAYVGYTTGSFDLLIEVHLPDNEALYRFLNEDLDEIEGIAYTDTWHILRTDTTNFEWAGEDVGRPPLNEIAGAGDEDG
jgi:Lrp/AsnC family transcriptional regulator for asnA, asnC and gidA